MKLPDGVKIFVGGKVLKGEVPDDLIPEKVKQKLGVKKPETGKKAEKGE